MFPSVFIFNFEQIHWFLWCIYYRLIVDIWDIVMISLTTSNSEQFSHTNVSIIDLDQSSNIALVP